jgi:deoxyadenosine/deoxycytidine kinase
MPSLAVGPRVEFCGGIGAGKSTVSRLLAAHYRLPFIQEHYEGVPFWKEFYQDPGAYAFEKNISFLLFHCNAARTAAPHSPHAPIVCDFALFQDLAYSSMSGDDDDYHATVVVHDRLVARIGSPALIIYVRCSVAEQLVRIKRRGRGPERAITEDYLENLSESIEAGLLRHVAGVPIIEVDTCKFDFVTDPSAGLSALIPAFDACLENAKRAQGTS